MKLLPAIILVFIQLTTFAQQGLQVANSVDDFPISKMLNTESPSSQFSQLNKQLLLLDFFGTWCVPCVKALPNLSTIQEKYNGKLQIVLISEEPQVKLENFLANQQSFHLPIVVDEKKEFIKRFQPPSYPYTVVVGANNKVLAIAVQEELTDENIEKWMEMQKTDVMITSELFPENRTEKKLSAKKDNTVEKSSNKLIQLSQDFMYAAKTGETTQLYVENLKSLSMRELTTLIKTDDEKKAFWINLYNAFTNISLKANPDQYKNRGQFFGNVNIEIAGNKFSLDMIEHGILRRSKIKWSLGYFNKLFPKKTEKALRVKRLDYRIHFALNCGAKSCPPIAFYKAETIDQQLDLATKAYLTGEAEYDASANSLKLPTLMSWFRRDFGGKKKMIALVQKLGIVPSEKKPSIKFKTYDWTLYLENYKN